tara:strand:+ start:646 stop:972 length:327 start_codon:yes stop_codon:yes gene_type:complete
MNLNLNLERPIAVIVPIIVEIIVVELATIKLFLTDDNNCSVDSKYIASSSNLVEYPKIDLYQSNVKPSQTIILIGLELKERKIIVNKGKYMKLKKNIPYIEKRCLLNL